LLESSKPCADRVDAALSTWHARLHSSIPGATFEKRAGHAQMLLPSVPRALFNGVVVEAEPCSGLAESIGEVEACGLPCGVQLRAGRHPNVEAEAARLGLTVRTELPGMAVAREEFADVTMDGLEILRADDAGLAEAARVTAAGFGVAIEMMRGLFVPELAGSGVSYYLGRVDGEAVTTAVGFRADDDVGIFGVATPPEHRRRGYGAAITAHAVRSGFETGADLAWLQTSPMAEPIYRTLGFRHIVSHAMLTRRTQ
jgi:ribosomal protein S18 acetylase RimI-like enzyme